VDRKDGLPDAPVLLSRPELVAPAAEKAILAATAGAIESL